MAKNDRKYRTGGRNARPMKRGARRSGIPPVAWLGLAGLVLVAVGLFLVRGSPAGSGGATAAAPIQVTGKPKLAVDQEKIDFGRVPLNKPVKATFKLTDTGDKPLTLAGTPAVSVLKGC